MSFIWAERRMMGVVSGGLTMLTIERVENPAREHFRKAHQLTVTWWPHFATLNRDERFVLFDKLGVELVLAWQEDDLVGSCLILPDTIGGQPVVWLSNFCSHPKARNAGALMLMRMMKWYETILCTGVTAEAAEVYLALRWQCYDRVWRCVHPINLAEMTTVFGDHISQGWMRAGIRLMGWVYHPFMRVAEFLGGNLEIERVAAVDASASLPERADARLALVASYLNAFATPGLCAALVGNIGRIVCDDLSGVARFRAYLTMRRVLRQYGAVMCEGVAITDRERRRALLQGAVPLRMPVYYWDRAGRLDGVFETFEQSGFSFAFCDKIY